MKTPKINQKKQHPLPTAAVLKKVHPNEAQECRRCKLYLVAKKHGATVTGKFYKGTTTADIAIVMLEPREQGMIDFTSKYWEVIEGYLQDSCPQATVYVTSVLKCFDGFQHIKGIKHLRNCAQFKLYDELAAVKPKVIWYILDDSIATSCHDAIVKEIEAQCNTEVLKVDDPRRIIHGDIKGFKLLDMAARSNTIVQNKQPKPDKVAVGFIDQDTINEIKIRKEAAIDLEWDKQDNINTVGIGVGNRCMALPFDKAKPLLKDLLKDPSFTLINHFLPEDVSRLLNHFQINCKFLDTFILKRELEFSYPEDALKAQGYNLLHIENYWKDITADSFNEYSNELAEYCAKDAWLAYQMHNLWKEHPDWDDVAQARELDHRMILPVADMMRTGINIDVEKITGKLHQLTLQVQQLERDFKFNYGVNITSPAQLLPWLKKNVISSLTSTKREELNKHAGNKTIQKVLQHREAAKELNTYAVPLYKLAQGYPKLYNWKYRLVLPGTITRRLASTAPAVMTLPPSIREIICSKFTKEDEIIGTLVSLDASQSEFVHLAYLADSDYLIKEFNSGKDFHQVVADLGNLQRVTAKNLNFGAIFLAGDRTLMNSIIQREGYSQATAEQIVVNFRKVYDTLGIEAYQQGLINESKKYGRVQAPYGCYGTRLGPTNVVNYPIQSFSGDANKRRLLWVYNELKRQRCASRVWLELHDAIELDVHPEEKKVVEEILQDCTEEFKYVDDVYGTGKQVQLRYDLKINGQYWR